jgi:hypothetical protein
MIKTRFLPFIYRFFTVLGRGLNVSINKNSITGVQEAAEEPNRAYKPKKPNLVPKHPPNIFEYIDSSYHSASAPKSPSSESSAISSFLPESPVPVVEKQSEKRRKILESSSDDDN